MKGMRVFFSTQYSTGFLFFCGVTGFLTGVLIFAFFTIFTFGKSPSIASSPAPLLLQEKGTRVEWVGLILLLKTLTKIVKGIQNRKNR